MNYVEKGWKTIDHLILNGPQAKEKLTFFKSLKKEKEEREGEEGEKEGGGEGSEQEGDGEKLKEEEREGRFESSNRDSMCPAMPKICIIQPFTEKKIFLL